MGTEHIVFRDAELNTELTLNEHSEQFDLVAAVLNHLTGGAVATIELRADLTRTEVELLGLKILQVALFHGADVNSLMERLAKLDH